MSTKPQIAAVAVSHSPLMVHDTEHRQGRLFRDGMARLRSAVEAFNPTLVVFFGPDHERALTSITPCFTVVESANGFAEWDLPEEDYEVPHGLAVALGEYVAASGVDIAVASSLQLDHGFGLSTKDIFGSLAAVPMVPILINCIERPLATAMRTATLGTAVGEFIRTEVPDGERVLVVGSGGISHTPPSQPPGASEMSESERQKLLVEQLAGAAQAINPDWDRDFLARLASTDWHRLADLTAEDLVAAGTGGAEVRTWIAAAFAAGEPLTTVAYEPVPEWITGMGIAASDTLLKS
ncbi:3-carboxyethylcatechol 2,3-dioxygenase [Streptomyces brasiliensis]|uniref:2,3-dihydroxyphenylpropionate 1,2-dioxygenase n=1 Tax=Streptomyces brasiliensis TaxID=1954 RepID=A0A917P8Z9_9ACTN|nr:3-carboxyethylcatechol 2,3-dioxygenase [Streptomyces brasiliensis]GGJ67131.1 2,3-dihydroxyphenylpropionate 1,2-dioxygenase [Streptomyces brasiliensis]